MLRGGGDAMKWREGGKTLKSSETPLYSSLAKGENFLGPKKENGGC